jgi:5'-3' exonuclease
MQQNKKNRVLVIDALNMYYRSYIVDPSLSVNGQPIGGVKGFLKILQKLIRETKPDQIIVAWDGPGGSRKRKSVNKDYKEGRKPIRLNRDIRNMSENEELENKVWQQTRLVEYLNELPVIQLMFPEVEADDIIAYVTKVPHYNGDEKIIISSDKDFFQLCDDETILFRPVQKQVLHKKNIIEQFDIHPENFALARAICGDKSDNLKGAPGAGLKSVAKRFPFFKEEKSCTLDEVVEACKTVDSDLKIYKSILENERMIRENYKIMQLYSPSISVQSKNIIKHTVKNFEFEFNKTEIIRMMNEDGFGVFDWSDLFSNMKRICLTKGEL